jgi:co-chaperonin GroES (HSP10)
VNPRPLRGRIVLRLAPELQQGLIIHPDQSSDLHRLFQKSLGGKGRHCHRGTVLAKGDPAYTRKGGGLVPHDFEVGDTVLFVYHHHESFSEGQEWDGLPALWVSQEEVIGVIE